MYFLSGSTKRPENINDSQGSSIVSKIHFVLTGPRFVETVECRSSRGAEAAYAGNKKSGPEKLTSQVCFWPALDWYRAGTDCRHVLRTAELTVTQCNRLSSANVHVQPEGRQRTKQALLEHLQ